MDKKIFHVYLAKESVPNNESYGCDLIREDNAVLSPYGLLHRADYEPMLSPIQQKQEKEMTMQ